MFVTEELQKWKKENDSLKIKLAKRDNEINKLTKENMILAKTLLNPKANVLSSADRFESTTEYEHQEFKVIDNIVANKNNSNLLRLSTNSINQKIRSSDISNAGKVLCD